MGFNVLLREITHEFLNRNRDEEEARGSLATHWEGADCGRRASGEACFNANNTRSLKNIFMVTYKFYPNLTLNISKIQIYAQIEIIKQEYIEINRVMRIKPSNFGKINISFYLAQIEKHK